MPYLFDTNHCIYLMNGWNTPEDKRTPEEHKTVNGLEQLAHDVVYMSEASVGELIYGIERSQRKASNRMRFHVLLSAVPPVPIVRGVWDIYGTTKAELSVKGIRIPDIDLLIASTAKYYELILVANDQHMRHLPKSFRRENWVTHIPKREE